MSFISPFRTELVLSFQNFVAMGKYLISLFVLLSGYAGAQITPAKYQQMVLSSNFLALRILVFPMII
jgi:hypothetical protein